MVRALVHLCRRWPAVIGLVSLLFAGSASAFPFAPLRMGGTPFEGTADGEASALWYNPAALVLSKDIRFSLFGNARLMRGEIDRESICPSTGAPGACGGATGFAPQSVQRDYVTGLGAAVFAINDSVSLAFGVVTPWLSCPTGASCPNANRPPSSYLGASESFTTIYYSLAAALRISSKLVVGGGISIVDATARMSFDRDTALDGGSATTATAGHENPNYAARVSASGDGGRFWESRVGSLPKPSGVATTLGFLIQPTPRLVFGASWQRVFATSPVFTSASPLGATVTAPPAAGDPCHGPCTGGDAILYSLPDVWQTGGRFIIYPDKLELEASARVITYGGYSRTDPTQLGVVVQLAGAPVSQAKTPASLPMDLGLQPEFAAEVGLRWQARPSLRIGGSLVLASSAVDSARVSATAFDGNKIDGMLGAQWQPVRWLRLVAAYGLTWMMPVTGNGQDPQATVRCVDSQYSVDACADTVAGRGLPSNAGTYSALIHHVTLGAEFQIDIHR